MPSATSMCTASIIGLRGLLRCCHPQYSLQMELLDPATRQHCHLWRAMQPGGIPDTPWRNPFVGAMQAAALPKIASVDTYKGNVGNMQLTSSARSTMNSLSLRVSLLRSTTLVFSSPSLASSLCSSTCRGRQAG